MAAPVNTFKKAIGGGRLQIGLWVALANPYAVEIAAGAGFSDVGVLASGTTKLREEFVMGVPSLTSGTM